MPALLALGVANEEHGHTGAARLTGRRSPHAQWDGGGGTSGDRRKCMPIPAAGSGTTQSAPFGRLAEEGAGGCGTGENIDQPLRRRLFGKGPAIEAYLGTCCIYMCNNGLYPGF